MNFSSTLGFLLMGTTLYVTVLADSPNPDALLDWKSIALVLGGTLAAGLCIFPFSRLLELEKFIWHGVILKKTTNVRQLAEDIVRAAVLPQSERRHLPHCEASHPFLLEGFNLIAENELDTKNLRDTLEKRSAYFKTSYSNDAKMLATLAKFPSSLGMLGSTVGLVNMMFNLGNGAEGIGPAMALALVTTFWGLITTYMILMPLADYAARLNSEDILVRQLIVEGLMLIKKNEKPMLVLRKVNGFLALQDRMSYRNIELSEDYVDQASNEVAQIVKKAA